MHRTSNAAAGRKHAPAPACCTGLATLKTLARRQGHAGQGVDSGSPRRGGPAARTLPGCGLQGPHRQRADRGACRGRDLPVHGVLGCNHAPVAHCRCGRRLGLLAERLASASVGCTCCACRRWERCHQLDQAWHRGSAHASQTQLQAGRSTWRAGLDAAQPATAPPAAAPRKRQKGAAGQPAVELQEPETAQVLPCLSAARMASQGAESVLRRPCRALGQCCFSSAGRQACSLLLVHVLAGACCGQGAQPAGASGQLHQRGVCGHFEQALTYAADA